MDTHLTVDLNAPVISPVARRPRLLPAATSSFCIPTLVVRPYVDEARFTQGPEYSVQINHERQSLYFPLGTADRDAAARNAFEILQTVRSEGWGAANERFPREFTVAIFWSDSPLTCSYSSIYSVPGELPERWKQYRKTAQPLCRTIIVQAEAGIRRALSFWIDRQPGFQCMGAFSSIQDVFNKATSHRGDLLLVDRELVERPGGTPLKWIRDQLPQTKTFRFGIYEESNYIFHSVTGVKSGYLLCRRPPARLFEPARALAREPQISWPRLQREIQVSFRALFCEAETAAPASQTATLTVRENDVLLALARGLSEKEVATALQISSQTVHNHVKSVYAKLGAHSRTEAVMKYLGR